MPVKARPSRLKGGVDAHLVGEAGFDVQLIKGESVAQTQADGRGDYQASLALWSGRPDPDGNTAIWLRCGAPLNWTGWCEREMDGALDRGEVSLVPRDRKAAYDEAAALVRRDLPYVVLYHFTWFWGLSAHISGFAPRPDGLVRPIGLSK